MRKMLLAGVAAGALVAGPAHAQIQNGAAGFFGFISGGYLFDDGPGPRLANFGGFQSQAKQGDGFGLDGKLGWAFGGGWDIAAAGAYNQFSAGRNVNLAATPSTFHLTDAKLWNIDGEVGYTLSGPGWGVRPALGVRYLRVIQETADPTAPFTNIKTRTRSWGIGPHVGVDGAFRVTDSLSLFGGLDTAFLFGNVRNSYTSTAGPNTVTRDSRMLWQIGGKLGVDWEVVPLFHIAAGYRFNFTDGATYATLGDVLGRSFGRGGVLEHGPFVRFAYNWGAPPAVAAPAEMPSTESFVVFFEFDRANLSAVALQTIKQAAAQAKAGNKTRIGVTGHTDRAGTEAYNMALSLRRANAVKNQLVQEGIPANQIMVVGKGETQPLVPTPDGVREPQNRRVEIVLG